MSVEAASPRARGEEGLSVIVAKVAGFVGVFPGPFKLERGNSGWKPVDEQQCLFGPLCRNIIVVVFQTTSRGDVFVIIK